MFKCETCGIETDDPTKLTDEYGQTYEVCNKCGDENSFIEVKKCDYCETEMIPEDEEFCDKCKKHIQEQFKTVMLENFKFDEIDYIDKVIEGRYLKDYLGYGDEK